MKSLKLSRQYKLECITLVSDSKNIIRCIFCTLNQVCKYCFIRSVEELKLVNHAGAFILNERDTIHDCYINGPGVSLTLEVHVSTLTYLI